MVTKINDPKIQAIDSIQKAKEADVYNGKTLTEQTEKDLFDSPLLKKDDGTDDPDKLRKAVWLLANLKEGKEIIKTEKMGLSTNAHEILTVLIGEQKADSEVYRAVNQIGNNQPVDKVITQFEDILFAEFEPSLVAEIDQERVLLGDYDEQEKKVWKEIDKLKEEYNDEIEEKQTTLETNIAFLVDKLKKDLQNTVGPSGHKFFECLVNESKISSEIRYKPTAPPSTEPGFESYGSVIKTGYEGNNKPYTHPLYLFNDLPSQIWTILKDIDKDKLFAYIDSADCSWSAKDKEKFKENFDQALSFKLVIYDAAKKNVMARSSTTRYFSNLFYVMHALFPQNKPSEWKNSPFLKKGEKSCLQFKNNKSLDKPYSIWWRGEDISIKALNYTDTSPRLVEAPFPGEEKYLTWANAQIPEFFWQVYNNDEAIDFSAYHEVLGPDAVTMVKARKDPITVYEKKIRVSNGAIVQASPSTTKILVDSYKGYVENFLKKFKDAENNPLIDVSRFRSEWGGIAEKMIKDFSREVGGTFAQRAKNIPYSEIKDKISIFSEDIASMISLYRGNEVDQVDEALWDRWDEWVRITETKRENLKIKKAKLGEEWSKLNEIDAKRTKSEIKIKEKEAAIESLKKNRVSGLITQFKTIWGKPGKRSYRELLFLRNILGWIKKWKNLLEPTNPFDPDAELAALDAAETVNQEKLVKYNNWVKKGTYFTERLEEWKKDDGKFFNEEAVKLYLKGIKDALESVGRGLDPVEDNERDQIDHYLKHGPVPMERRILPMELKAALGVKTNVFRDLTHKWIDYSQNIDFKIKANEIEQLANRVNKPGSKIEAPVIKYCKEVLAKKPELIEDDTYDLPAANASNREWLDWFFTRDPEVVVGTIALHELKVDNNLKERILQEMKDYKNSKDNLILLDRTIYGNGENFTEEGIIKYYSEKLGGQNHATRKYEQPFQDSEPTLSFWRWSNPGAYLSVLGLLALGGGLVWAWLRRKKLVAWWNQPIEAQGEEFDEEDEW